MMQRQKSAVPEELNADPAGLVEGWIEGLSIDQGPSDGEPVHNRQSEEPTMLSKLIPIVAALLFLAPSLASAQDAPPVRIRGTIETADATRLVVKARDGSSLTVVLPAQVVLATVLKKSLDDIKTGDFVGSAAMKGADGKLHAMEVHIFPESMRGTGEGHRPWDAGPDSSMTNATVGEVVAAPEGKTIKVTYKGGTQEIVVAPDTPIVTFAPADPTMLQPGKAVFIVANKAVDGTLTARFVQVESNGVKPPL